MSSRTPRRRKGASAPTIALCVIARDEAEQIGACIDSARRFVDEVVVVDTGSVDRTVEIAREHGARVELFAWRDDFAAARNAAIDATRADWILMLDADEELEAESGPALRHLAAEAATSLHCYMPRIESALKQGDSSRAVFSYHGRFFPRRRDLRFVGCIHEELKYLPAPSRTRSVLAPSIHIRHSGYLPEQYRARGKDARNTRLLEQELAKDPDNATLHFYAGMQHAAMQRHREAAASLARSIELLDGETPRFKVDAYTLLLNSLRQLGEGAEVERVASAAEREGLLGAKARELVADHFTRRGRAAEAERHLLAALQPDCARGLTEYPGAGTWSTRGLLAHLYEQTGRPKQALAQIQLVLSDPQAANRVELARGAVRLASALRDPSAALRWLDAALESGHGDLAGQVDSLRECVPLVRSAGWQEDAGDASTLRGAVVREEWQRAYDAAMARPLQDPGASAWVVYLATRLREGGAPEAALDLLGRVLDVSQDAPIVHWQLMRTLTDLGRYDDALLAAEVLSQLPGAAGLALAA